MKPARRNATYEDLLDLPDGFVGEIIEGDLYASPRPASPHAWACSSIGQDLGPWSRRPGIPGAPGGWWILDEPELHFSADMLVPDLGGWRHQRMPSIPRVPFFELAPDWACEVLSPTTRRLDRIGKMPIYAREGVRHLWLVDPLAHTLEVYRLEGGRWAVAQTFGGTDSIRAEPFEEIALDLGRWWID